MIRPDRAGQIKGHYTRLVPGFSSGPMCRQRYRHGFEIRRERSEPFCHPVPADTSHPG